VRPGVRLEADEAGRHAVEGVERDDSYIVTHRQCARWSRSERSYRPGLAFVRRSIQWRTVASGPRASILDALSYWVPVAGGDRDGGI
jgi:hypothetical protein